jgi:toxin HigB-1
MMRIRSTRSKPLKRLVEDDDDREIRRDLVNRVRRIITALISAPDVGGLEGLPGWRIHQLTGDRAGTWSISVSRNWRITFTLEGDTIKDLDLEDYH